MVEIVIEKNIPLKLQRRDEGFSKAFREMEIGDSFACEFTAQRRQGIYSVATRQGIKVSVSVTGDKMRVWRVE